MIIVLQVSQDKKTFTIPHCHEVFGAKQALKLALAYLHSKKPTQIEFQPLLHFHSVELDLSGSCCKHRAKSRLSQCEISIIHNVLNCLNCVLSPL